MIQAGDSPRLGDNEAYRAVRRSLAHLRADESGFGGHVRLALGERFDQWLARFAE